MVQRNTVSNFERRVERCAAPDPLLPPVEIVRFVSPTQTAAKAVDVRIVDHKAKQAKPAQSSRVLSVMFHGPADPVQQATQMLRKNRKLLCSLGVYSFFAGGLVDGEWKSSGDFDLQSILGAHEVPIDQARLCSNAPVLSAAPTSVWRQVRDDIYLAAQQLQVELDPPALQDSFKIRTLGSARLDNAELKMRTAVSDACVKVCKKRMAPPDSWEDQQTNAQLFPLVQGSDLFS